MKKQNKSWTLQDWKDEISLRDDERRDVIKCVIFSEEKNVSTMIRNCGENMRYFDRGEKTAAWAVNNLDKAKKIINESQESIDKKIDEIALEKFNKSKGR